MSLYVCLSGGALVLLLAWKQLRSPAAVPRARSVSIPSAFLLKGPYPSDSGVPLNVILGLLMMEQVPTRAELAAHLRKALAEHFVRFRSVPSVPSNGKSFEMIEMDVDKMRVEVEHVTEMEVADEDEILAFANEKLVKELPRNKPLWEFIILKNKSNPKRSAVLGIYDHALGDGISAIAIFNSLFTDEHGKCPNMSTSFARRKPTDVSSSAAAGASSSSHQHHHRHGSNSKSLVHSVVNFIPSLLCWMWMIVHSLVKVLILASPFCLQDCMTAISGPLIRKQKKWSCRRVIWTKPLSLEALRSVRLELGVTINDLLTNVLSGTCRRYLEHVRDPVVSSSSSSSGRIRALMPAAMPRPTDPEKPLRNFFAMLSTSLHLFETDRKKRLMLIHKDMTRLKNSPEALFTMLVQKFGFAFMPIGNLQQMCRDLFCSHSILWSNIPGPAHPVFLCGKRVQEIKPAVATLQHQVTAMSYNGAISVAFMVDTDNMKDAHLLTKYFEEEFDAVAHLAAEK